MPLWCCRRDVTMTSRRHHVAVAALRCRHSDVTPPPGVHTVEVSYGGSPLPAGPFRVAVTEGCDPSRVRVHGPGIAGGTARQPNCFTVETR